MHYLAVLQYAMNCAVAPTILVRGRIAPALSVLASESIWNVTRTKISQVSHREMPAFEYIDDAQG